MEHRSIRPGREALPENLPERGDGGLLQQQQVMLNPDPRLYPGTALQKAVVTLTAHYRIHSAPAGRENEGARSYWPKVPMPPE